MDRGQLGKLAVERGYPGYSREGGRSNWRGPNPSWMELVIVNTY